jgi:predicted transcriptional regulator
VRYIRTSLNRSAVYLYSHDMATTPTRTIRIDDELWAALERVGKEQERTNGWMVRKAIEQYIEAYRAVKRATKGKQ